MLNDLELFLKAFDFGVAAVALTVLLAMIAVLRAMVERLRDLSLLERQQVEKIAALEDKVDAGLLRIELRFDELPARLKREVIDALRRERTPNRLLRWLFGEDRDST
jgi:hypothetical protein